MPRTRCAALLLLALAALSGCGRSYDWYASVYLDNNTDTTTSEDVDAFRVAQFGEPFTGDLLGAPLAPGDVEFLGDFQEDYYDAEADLSLGGLVEWFDEAIYGGDTFHFDVF